MGMRKKNGLAGVMYTAILSAIAGYFFRTAQLTGGYAFIENLKGTDVHLFVDVSGLTEGVYTLPVQIHIDNAPEFTCALGLPEVTVTLRAKP